MCTALSILSGCHYFGRTLDLEYHYSESITVTPRNYALVMRHLPSVERHHAMIGMAVNAGGYPLYYDAVNEKGLAAAALNFPVSARYFTPSDKRDNIASFELIPWVLGQCSDAAQAAELLEGITVTDTAFGAEYPPTPLHWIIADRHRCFVAEPTADGLILRENPVRVMTNEPAFDLQLHSLNNYPSLSALPPENRWPNLDLVTYSRGMGALGLPGDFSSASRFVRTAFVSKNSVCDRSESSCVNQFFHIMDTVTQPRGCVRVDGGYVTTVYTSCCNTDLGIYYYNTYENRSIACVELGRCDPEGSTPVSYPLLTGTDFIRQN